MTAQQLKNSILQMAVQGKLVPQDPNDEPASVLLERIRAEKERLIKDGKIKKEKNPSRIFRGSDNLPYEKIGDGEPVCIADEVPFEIPESWEWVRLGSVCEIARGGSPRPIKEFLTNSSSGINWIKIGDSDKGGKYINQAQEKITPEGALKSRLVHKGDFLLSNSMSFGRPYILNIDGCIHDGWLVLSGYSHSYLKDYLFYMLSSRFAFFQFCNVVSGAVVKNLNSDKVASALFPLPPFAEQQRIVAKIEELLPYIDKYGKAESEATMLNIAFPEVLKKSILQWAVQGKIVPQDPNDEPASVLLERIRTEKERLIKEGKIKRDKHESVIFRRDNSYYEKLGGIERCIDDEVPFEIPENWEWCRLGQIGNTNIGLTYRPSDKTMLGGTLVLRSSNIQNDKMDYNDNIYVSCSIPEKAMIHKGDILICARNGSRALVGKCAIVDKDGMAFGAFMAKFSSPFNPYVKLFIDSPIFRQQLNGVKTETINQITQDMLKNQLIPLPPLAEQHRIVDKIDSILPILKTL